MQTEQIVSKLNEVFADVFDDQSIVLTRNTTAAQVPGWDSLQHINLMLAVEDAFGLKFTMAEVQAMQNVGELIDAIAQRA